MKKQTGNAKKSPAKPQKRHSGRATAGHTILPGLCMFGAIVLAVVAFAATAHVITPHGSEAQINGKLWGIGFIGSGDVAGKAVCFLLLIFAAWMMLPIVAKLFAKPAPERERG